MDTPCVFCEVESWFSDCCPSQQPEQAVTPTIHKSCFHFAPVSGYPDLLVLSCWLQNSDGPIVVLPFAQLLMFILLLFHSPAAWPTFSFSDRTQSFALLPRWYLLNYKKKTLDDLGLLGCDAVSLCVLLLLPTFRRIIVHSAPRRRRLNHRQEHCENLKFRSACLLLMHYEHAYDLFPFKPSHVQLRWPTNYLCQTAR